MSVGSRGSPTVWVRDEGQRYVPEQRVDWIRGREPRLVGDPLGAYEVVHAASDPAMAPERWLKVQLRPV